MKHITGHKNDISALYEASESGHKVSTLAIKAFIHG